MAWHDPERAFDEALEPLGELVGGFVDVTHAHESGVMSLEVERMTLELPFEVEVSAEGGTVRALGAAPPTQYVETTVMPVFHRLRVRMERDDGR